MRTINIGMLNKRLTFKRLANVKDRLGQDKKELVKICEVWGSLYPIRGSEFYEVQKIEGMITHKCYVRYRSDINSSDFIEYQGRRYTIESVVDVDLDHKMLEIMCSEYINKEMIPDAENV